MKGAGIGSYESFWAGLIKRNYKSKKNWEVSSQDGTSINK